MTSRSVRRLADSGALPAAVGLAVQAGATYLTLVIAGRYLGPSRFVAISALFVLINAVSAGLFLPLEQEVARRRGTERVLSIGDPALARNALRLGLLISAAAIAIAIAANPILLRLFNHNANLLGAFCLALPGYACCFLLRGIFAGAAETTRYGIQLAAEGVYRLIALAVLAVVASAGVSEAGWIFGATPWVALGVCLIGRQASPRPEVEVSTGHTGLMAPIGLLVLSSLAAQLLINAGPVVVQLLSKSSEHAQAGAYLAALVIIRLPVVLFVAAQPIFLPAMAAHAAAARDASFRSLLTRGLRACGVLSVLSTVALVAIGPPSLRLVFGFHNGVSRATFALTGIAVGLFLAGSIMSQALLALGAHLATTAGWLLGSAGLAFGTFVGHGAVARATYGFLFGAITVAAVFGALLTRRGALGPIRAS